VAASQGICGGAQWAVEPGLNRHTSVDLQDKERTRLISEDQTGKAVTEMGLGRLRSGGRLCGRRRVRRLRGNVSVANLAPRLVSRRFRGNAAGPLPTSRLSGLYSRSLRRSSCPENSQDSGWVRVACTLPARFKSNLPAPTASRTAGRNGHPIPTPVPGHIGEPNSPPLLHPPKEPLQTELDMGFEGAESDEAAQDALFDYLDQSPEFGPAGPEPLPEDDFDQRWEAGPLRPSGPAAGAPGISNPPFPPKKPPQLPFFNRS
jgi:hypothetical protein